MLFGQGQIESTPDHLPMINKCIYETSAGNYSYQCPRIFTVI